MTSEPRCPVCQARFRGARTCSRCGADLTPLLLLTVRAWQLREQARERIAAGAVEEAAATARNAQALVSTPEGGSLLALARWLHASATAGAGEPGTHSCSP